MESLIFINTRSASAQNSITSCVLPQVACKLLSQWQVQFSFFGPSTDPAPLTGATFRFALKATAEGAALVYSSSLTNSEAVYTADIASVDSPALRTLIGEQVSVSVIGEIEWTISGRRERAHFPVIITNAWNRPDDVAPDPIAEASTLWFNQQLASKATTGGYIEFQLTDGTWVNFALNTGRAPN